VVYISVFQGFEHGQNGPELGGRHARQIDAGEARALLALAAGEQIVSTPESGGLRVIGPIRARSQCLGCHRDKQVGDLLGALSYRLEPAWPQNARK
jgi:mono/diheme cytochrome c family protein